MLIWFRTPFWVVVRGSLDQCCFDCCSFLCVCVYYTEMRIARLVAVVLWMLCWSGQIADGQSMLIIYFRCLIATDAYKYHATFSLQCHFWNVFGTYVLYQYKGWAGRLI